MQRSIILLIRVGVVACKRIQRINHCNCTNCMVNGTVVILVISQKSCSYMYYCPNNRAISKISHVAPEQLVSCACDNKINFFLTLPVCGLE